MWTFVLRQRLTGTWLGEFPELPAPPVIPKSRGLYDSVRFVSEEAVGNFSVDVRLIAANIHEPETKNTPHRCLASGPGRTTRTAGARGGRIVARVPTTFWKFDLDPHSTGDRVCPAVLLQVGSPICGSPPTAAMHNASFAVWYPLDRGSTCDREVGTASARDGDCGRRVISKHN
jgi:hypothetical protein